MALSTASLAARPQSVNVSWKKAMDSLVVAVLLHCLLPLAMAYRCAGAALHPWEQRSLQAGAKLKGPLRRVWRIPFPLCSATLSRSLWGPAYRLPV